MKAYDLNKTGMLPLRVPERPDEKPRCVELRGKPEMKVTTVVPDRALTYPEWEMHIRMTAP